MQREVSWLLSVVMPVVVVMMPVMMVPGLRGSGHKKAERED
jgi:hypothetical protein